jgi:PAS domain S-box-containing protein
MEEMRQAKANVELEFRAGARPDEQPRFSLRPVFGILASGACYYLATRIAWELCFPDSKVSLFFPPHAVLVSILLLVPTRHWWAYTLAAACSHFFATQQAEWPPLYALHCEAFDAVQNVTVAAGIRIFIKSPFNRITLREATIFVLIAVVVVPFGTAFWGAAFTVSNHFGTDYWVEWRNLGVSNGVTAIVLVPAILLGVQFFAAKEMKVVPRRVLEAFLLAVGVLAVGYVAFNRSPAGPDMSPVLLYAPVPLLIWATLRFGLGGMSASMLVITILAIWGTMHGHGPFLTQTPAENALALQLFLLMVATPLMLLAVAIGDERHSKEALRVSEERMILAAESAQLALWDWDTANDSIWMTEEGRKFYGFEPGEPIDHATLAGRVHTDDRAARATVIQHGLTTDGSYEAEYRIILPDRSVRWIASRGRSLSRAGNGAPPRILGVSIDITRRKRAELEVEQRRQELAHVSRVSTMGELSASIAHELNQPLTGVLTNAQAALRFLAQDPPNVPELFEILDDIIEADRRASEVIRRLRSLLRMGAIEPVTLEVNDIVGEVLKLLSSDAMLRHVTIESDLAPGLPSIRGDGIQLQQVILNLVVNAMDAMNATEATERRVVIRTRATEQNTILVSVVDKGPGIEKEKLGQIFQPFFTTKAEGMGMGLSIARTIVEAHGGELRATNNQDRGATFLCRFPASQEGADAPMDAVPAARARQA